MVQVKADLKTVLTEFVHVLCEKCFHLVAVGKVDRKLVVIIRCIETRSFLYQIPTAKLL